MQIAFNRCVKNGGEVKRATGPDAEFGLKEGEYRDYCWKEGMKKSALGNKHKFRKSKSKAIIAGAILTATIGGYVITGGGFTNLDTGIVTNQQYQEIKSELFDKFFSGQLSPIELFYGDSYRIQQYRDVIKKEGEKGTFKDLKNITQENLLPEIIKKLKN